MLMFTFLSENKTECPDYLAEHGLSIYIETDEMNILFDAGASATVFQENAKMREIDLAEADVAVVSHGHYDHTQGFPAFCEINDKAKIYIHRNAFRESYGLDENEELEEKTCGILWTEDQKRKMKSRMVFTEYSRALSEDIVISGSIPDALGSIKTAEFFFKNEQGKLIRDDMSHEQFLIVRNRDRNGESSGIYIFSGCSHKGIKSIIQYARTLFPKEDIAGFIAGMHLIETSQEEREKALNELLKQKIKVIVPAHCTGLAAICELKSSMGHMCAVASAGNQYLFM